MLRNVGHRKGGRWKGVDGDQEVVMIRAARTCGTSSGQQARPPPAPTAYAAGSASTISADELELPTRGPPRLSEQLERLASPRARARTSLPYARLADVEKGVGGEREQQMCAFVRREDLHAWARAEAFTRGMRCEDQSTIE